MTIRVFKKPMIPIERASEELILELIGAGVLEIKSDGLHVTNEKETSETTH